MTEVELIDAITGSVDVAQGSTSTMKALLSA